MIIYEQSKSEDSQGGETRVLEEVLDNTAKLRLSLGANDRRPEANFYWHGKSDFGSLVEFFEQNYPPSSSSRFSALAFAQSGEVERNNVTDLANLVRELPQDAEFLRLEHVDGTTPPERPDFIIWSNLRSDKAFDTDRIGVSGTHEWLNAHAAPLANLVSATHAENVDRSTSVRGVQALLQAASP